MDGLHYILTLFLLAALARGRTLKRANVVLVTQAAQRRDPAAWQKDEDYFWNEVKRWQAVREQNLKSQMLRRFWERSQS